MSQFRRHIAQLFLAGALVTGSGCASNRVPVPVGTIPQQTTVSEADEQYGQQVFGMLLQEYQLSRNDAHINRARRITERLTDTAGAGHNIWHVHVLDDDSVVNAAATRGNYLFVWSGMFGAVENDAELAAVLGHEIAHVLAGHVAPTPGEAVNEMLASTSGEIAARIIASQGGAWGAAAGIAGAIVNQTFRAVAVNPESQRHELEADQIGVFLMADAGYDPKAAADFWRRAQSNPSFAAGDTLGYFSTHPSSGRRLEELEKLERDARARFLAAQR